MLQGKACKKYQNLFEVEETKKSGNMIASDIEIFLLKINLVKRKKTKKHPYARKLCKSLSEEKKEKGVHIHLNDIKI